jgi:hypothetical protein
MKPTIVKKNRDKINEKKKDNKNKIEKRKRV